MRGNLRPDSFRLKVDSSAKVSAHVRECAMIGANDRVRPLADRFLFPIHRWEDGHRTI